MFPSFVRNTRGMAGTCLSLLSSLLFKLNLCVAIRRHLINKELKKFVKDFLPCKSDSNRERPIFISAEMSLYWQDLPIYCISADMDVRLLFRESTDYIDM